MRSLGLLVAEEIADPALADVLVARLGDRRDTPRAIRALVATASQCYP